MRAKMIRDRTRYLPLPFWVMVGNEEARATCVARASTLAGVSSAVTVAAPAIATNAPANFMVADLSGNHESCVTKGKV